MPTGIYVRKIIKEKYCVKIARFWSNVEKGPNCWEWSGCINGGYGVFFSDGAKKKAHRISWELLKGKIPDGLVIDHICRNSSCVNPDHLEPVTSGENTRRGISHNRMRTHCKYGHEFTNVNTYRRPDTTSRGCRICRLWSVRRYVLKNK